MNMQSGHGPSSDLLASHGATLQQPQPAMRERRYEELDSLRGVAALTVVFYHFRRMWVWSDPAPKWLVLLNPVTVGHEAVILFFLLSGFVLSVPILQGKGQPYPVYLVRRILRIYAPYLAALALSVAGAAMWHGPLGHGYWADQTWFYPVSLRLVLAHIAMLGNYDWAQYNTAFWSLVIEMRISIIFPFLFLLVRRLRTGMALVLAVLLESLGMILLLKWPQSEMTVDTVLYAGVFVAGIVLAMQVERVNAWFRGLGGLVQVGVGAVSFVLFTFGHHLGIFLRYQVGFDLIFITLGAVGYMTLAMNAVWVKAMLHMAWARFLGRISYSLYLVHGTVLFAVTHVLGKRVPVAGQLFLYLTVTLLLGYGFCLVAEEPFLRLSRWVGKSAWAQRVRAKHAAASGGA